MIKPVGNKRKKKRKLNQLKERKTNGTNDIIWCDAVGAATCEDSLVLFENLAATVAGQTPPATGVSTLDECRARCLQDERCAGLNWMRDGRNDTDKCLLYSVLIGDTTVLNLFDLYVRERCQPNMFITFGPGLYMCVHVPYSYYLFLLTFPICIFPSSFFMHLLFYLFFYLLPSRIWTCSLSRL